MREPRCYRIVKSKNLWEIAIEFLGKIDTKLMDNNLKQAYITYRICKLRAIPYDIFSKLVFLSCFNEVGKFYGDQKSDEQIETYLFLKYFSPVKNHADAYMSDIKGHKMSIAPEEAVIFKACKDYTKLLAKTDDKYQAFAQLKENIESYDQKTIKALEKLVNKVDLIYEFNSFHYKTVVYKYISRTIFSPKDKNKFITMLSSLFEMYSAQTLYHSKLTAIVSYMLAKYMKIKHRRAKRIYMAGLCHDLGKVCIPLKILEKPDKLTDREYTIMKKHVTFTKDILDQKMDYEIVEMAYRHHEKLDGSGYPNKLKGKYLTIDQRVLQVADIISALIAKRSYKEAWDISKTISILEDMANNFKIDADVVNCFKQKQAKILKATRKFTEQADKIYEKINKERENLIKQKGIIVKKVEPKAVKVKEAKEKENVENKEAIVQEVKEDTVEENKENTVIEEKNEA